LRIACAVGSNSRDSSSGLRPDRTNSTICRRNSGGYALLRFDIVDSSFPKDEVPTERGQLQIWIHRQALEHHRGAEFRELLF
jgi:hypothetical protein